MAFACLNSNDFSVFSPNLVSNGLNVYGTYTEYILPYCDTAHEILSGVLSNREVIAIWLPECQCIYFVYSYYLVSKRWNFKKFIPSLCDHCVMDDACIVTCT